MEIDIFWTRSRRGIHTFFFMDKSPEVDLKEDQRRSESTISERTVSVWR